MLRRSSTLSALTVLVLASWSGPALAQDPPAGGASTEEVVVSAISALLFLAGALGLVVARRRGQLGVLDRLAGFAGRRAGLPGWAALPLAIAGGSLIIAVFGFYWDVATHIDHGRDDGVFGNAAHWPILIGLTGLAVAGLVSLLLGGDEERGATVGPRGWRMPVGGALLLLCGVIALIGFPIDDLWHRIFGQDVTLWSPPHIQMVLGASLCTIAMWLLFIEAERAQPTSPAVRGRRRLQEIALAGAVLIGLSTLQGEFDFGVPQFHLLFQPVLVAVAAGLALVPARLRLGRGGALLAVAFFLLLRGALSLVVSGAFDHVVFHLPLYLGSAIVVELVALRVPIHRQLTFGALAGAGIGTVGLATEAAWTQVAMPVAWSWSLMPGIALVALPAAVAAGVAGGMLGRALRPADSPPQPAPRLAAPAAAVVLVAALAYPLSTTGLDATAAMSLEEIEIDGREHASLTVALDPPDAAAGAHWFHVIAWQGADWWSDERARQWALEPVGEGTFRTAEPVPVHGDWKTMVRLHSGRVMAAAPVYLPLDRAIPAQEVPARSEVTRDFVPDHDILLREMRPAPAWLTGLAHALMGLLALIWVTAFVAGTRHLRRSAVSEATHPAAGERSAPS